MILERNSKLLLNPHKASQDHMLCIYDMADMDGLCSAAIVKHAFPHCKMFPYRYGMEIPFDRFDVETTVIMVDISADPEVMAKIYKRSQLFIWIDHHKRAIDQVQAAGLELQGKQVVGTAACVLTWKYFYASDVPKAVELLGKYDVWDHEDPDVLPFQYGARLRIDGLDSPLWEPLLQTNYIEQFAFSTLLFKQMIADGKICLEYQVRQNRMVAKYRGFECTLDGYSVIACNGGGDKSTWFDSVWDPEKYDLAAYFYLLPSGNWHVSLRTKKDDVDVSEIAKKRGGGGHKRAARYYWHDVPLKPGSIRGAL